jgi:hypothetical protein
MIIRLTKSSHLKTVLNVLKQTTFLLLLKHFSYGDVVKNFKKLKHLNFFKTVDCLVQVECGVLASLQPPNISQKLCTSQWVQSKVYIVFVACLWYGHATGKGRCKIKPLQLVQTDSDFRILKWQLNWLQSKYNVILICGGGNDWSNIDTSPNLRFLKTPLLLVSKR